MFGSRSIRRFESPSIERSVRANLSNDSFIKPGTDYMFYTIEPSIQQCQVSQFTVPVLRGNRLIWGFGR
jgi:hypothetical protein